MAMISTRGRYALRVMVDLAEHGGREDYLPLKEIAARQEISEKYLESIVKSLVQGKLLQGSRGKGGGYRLTEGDLAPVACLEEGAQACDRAQRCPTLPVWIRLNGLIRDFLDSVTLADLMREGAPEARP